MKKIFEKHCLFKLLMILVLVISLLAWICNTTYFSNGELIEQEIKGLGYFDIVYAAILGLSNFFEIFGFIITVCVFYKILGCEKVYQQLVTNIASKVNPNLFMIASLVILAFVTSIISNPIMMIMFIPFIISVLARLKVDKVASIASTFGAVMIGTICSTYSTGVAANYKTSLSIELGDGVLYQFIALALLVVVMSIFVVLRNKKSNEAIKDTFGIEIFDKKVSTIPLLIVMILLFVISTIAFIPWNEVFGIEIFTNMHKSVTEATLFGDTIFYNILGNTLSEFGAWSLSNLIGFILVILLVIKIIYRIPFDKMLDEGLNGIKSSMKVFVLTAVSYTILVIALSYPVLPGLLNKILEIDLNFFTIFVVGILAAIFVTDPYYIVALISGGVLAFENSTVAAIALQCGAGIAGLFAPTSILLILGLSLYNVEYKDWMKFIGKFVLASIVITCVVMAICLFV